MSLLSKRFLLRTGLVLSSVLVLSACSSLDFDVGDRIDYKNSKTINALEVPPDLKAPDYDPTYSTIPSGAVSASALAKGNAQTGRMTVLPISGGVQMMSSGNVRWLQVAAPAEAVWPKLQDFWRTIGVAIKRDEPRVGIMETEWAENRAEIPMDGVRQLLSKAFEGMFDAGSRDRFTIRLERPSAQVTNVYLSHERAEEQVTGTGTKWEYKPAKPELEAYEYVADKLGVRLDECVFTDDRELFCEAARACGMQAKRGRGRGKFPMLVGQYTNYLKRQMDLYIKGDRPHDEEGKTGILNTLQEKDLHDILAYLTTLQEPTE